MSGRKTEHAEINALMVACDNCPEVYIDERSRREYTPKYVDLMVQSFRDDAPANAARLRAVGWHISTLCPKCREAAIQ